MPYGVESTTTSRGTLIDYELHKGPFTTGVNAHWGEKIPDDILKERILEAFHGDVKLDERTGFDVIYHQKDRTSRKNGISDELEVAELVLQKTLDANDWRAEDVSGLLVGSGVPIADNPQYADYAGTLAKKMGLNSDIFRHNTYAACASGGLELISALKNPDLQGKKVIVMGMEGITYFTPFNPRYTDALSMRFFSNGAAGIALVPGETMSLLTSSHDVIEDEEGLLSGQTTYKKLIKKGGGLWQENGNTSLLLMPQPDKGKRLMFRDGRGSALYFIHNELEQMQKTYQKHLEDFPNLPAQYGVAHYPSETVFNNLSKKAGRVGINVPFETVVNDGNSSAATSLIAHNRTMSINDMAREGSVELFVAFGAGGSFNTAVILHEGLPLKLSD